MIPIMYMEIEREVLKKEPIKDKERSEKDLMDESRFPKKNNRNHEL